MAMYSTKDQYADQGNVKWRRYNDSAADAQEFVYGEIAADNALDRSLYSAKHMAAAQMEGLKNAGLSPSIYASGGVPSGGGASGLNGGGASTHSQQAEKMNAILNASMQASSLASQIAKTKAETDYIKAQTATESGNNSRGAAEIENLLLNQNLTKAKTNFTNYQAANQQIKNYVDNGLKDITIQTATFEMYKSAYSAKQCYFESLNAGIQFNIQSQTQNDQIKAIRLQNANYFADLLVKDSNIKLNEAKKQEIAAQIDKWEMDVYQKWVELDIHQQEADVQQKWLENQYEILVERLELDKTLQPEQIKYLKTKMWVDFGSNILSTAVYGSAMYFAGPLAPVLGKTLGPKTPHTQGGMPSLPYN